MVMSSELNLWQTKQRTQRVGKSQKRTTSTDSYLTSCWIKPTVDTGRNLRGKGWEREQGQVFIPQILFSFLCQLNPKTDFFLFAFIHYLLSPFGKEEINYRIMYNHFLL